MTDLEEKTAKKPIICKIPETMCLILKNECNKVKDHLTGLGNEKMFKEKMGQAVAFSRRYGKEHGGKEHEHQLSLVVVDIDYFKSINDKYKHSAGNEVLKTVADILKKNIRDADFIARMFQKGDEFTMGLPNTGYEKAIFVAEKLRAAVSKHYFERIKRNITLTAGIADLETVLRVDKKAKYYTASEAADKMLDYADEALIEGKLLGRNQVRVYGLAKL